MCVHVHVMKYSGVLYIEQDFRMFSLTIHKLFIVTHIFKSMKWVHMTSCDLSVLQQRNKPREPPKPPKIAPFFLPTLPGLVPKFVTGDNDGDIPSEEAAGSKIVNLGALEPMSEFQKCLTECAATENCENN